MGKLLFGAFEQQSVARHTSAAEGNAVYLLPEAGQDLVLQSKPNNTVHFMVSLVPRSSCTNLIWGFKYLLSRRWLICKAYPF